MSKLLFNQEPIVKQVIPSLDSGINFLDRALVQLKNMKVNSSTPCINEIMSAEELLRNIYISLSKERRRFENIPRIIQELEEQQKILSSIPIVEITKRDKFL